MGHPNIPPKESFGLSEWAAKIRFAQFDAKWFLG